MDTELWGPNLRQCNGTWGRYRNFHAQTKQNQRSWFQNNTCRIRSVLLEKGRLPGRRALLRAKVLCSFETSRSAYAKWQRHVPEGRHPQKILSCCSESNLYSPGIHPVTWTIQDISKIGGHILDMWFMDQSNEKTLYKHVWHPKQRKLTKMRLTTLGFVTTTALDINTHAKKKTFHMPLPVVLRWLGCSRHFQIHTTRMRTFHNRCSK